MTKPSAPLLPCPFCGHQSNADDDDTLYPATRTKSLWQVVCAETYGGCTATVLGRTPEEAIECWNRRASPQVPREPTREMREALINEVRVLSNGNFYPTPLGARRIWCAAYDASPPRAAGADEQEMEAAYQRWKERAHSCQLDERDAWYDGAAWSQSQSAPAKGEG